MTWHAPRHLRQLQLCIGFVRLCDMLTYIAEPCAPCAAQVLLNVLADEIHRAHQRCLRTHTCDPYRCAEP